MQAKFAYTVTYAGHPGIAAMLARLCAHESRPKLSARPNRRAVENEWKVLRLLPAHRAADDDGHREPSCRCELDVQGMEN